ncbi:GGDEF domain-containing protein [Asanoa sp. WMMD1127]|uniref:GGDEF domain-containing protein n=1 Tax=Asanoa sp. WMMD1127 TaxID=3016107 RepID=UPI002415EE4A|nr:GGDEF domain-containing protein [Asanoa sp. WMMD1127]MDG4826652.1 GGDEF domain-containing protein [Asanoa sp. WMMD1127]
MDRILGGALLTFAAAAVAIGWGPAPGVASWAEQAVLLAGFTVLSWRLAQRRGQPATRRRFWETAAVGGLILTAGAVLRAVESIADPASATAIRIVPAILLTAGTGVLLASMLARPWRIPRRQRVRLWLDIVIVLVGAAVAIWVVTVVGRHDADRPAEVGWVVVGAVTLGVAAFALVRVVFTESTPVRVLAGVTLTVGLALFGVERLLRGAALEAPDLRAILVTRMVPALVLLAGARFEQLRRPPAAVPPRARRSGARLPFLAIVVTQAVLVVELAVNGLAIRTWGALAGSVVVTALVLVRQHLVLADNERLVRRLDETVETLNRQEERLRHAASHDHLTGLANRAYFDQQAARLGRERDGRRRAVLLLDLNDFKDVNDTLGHQAGDDLLRVTAQRLRRCVRPGDTVARLGGDEFSVLLSDTSAEDAVATAHRIHGALGREVRVDGRLVRPSASIGIAVGGRPYEALLRDADAAMYEAKRRHSGFHLRPEN